MYSINALSLFYSMTLIDIYDSYIIRKMIYIYIECIR